MTLEVLTLRNIMRKFQIWSLAMLLHHIDHAIEVFKPTAAPESPLRDEKIDPHSRKLFLDTIIHMAQIIGQEIKLESALNRVWDNGHFCMSNKLGMTHQEAYSELRTLRQSIEDDLEKRTFAFVLPLKADLAFSEAERKWGNIKSRFPNAAHDVDEANNSYALELNTACVFHAMRVAEFGLRSLARNMRVSLPKKKPLDWGQWQEIINEMEKKADLIGKNRKPGAAKDEALSFYRGAIGEFYGFKDVYRNHVMHTRERYDEYQAASSLTKVCDFMNRLALKVNEKGKGYKTKGF